MKFATATLACTSAALSLAGCGDPPPRGGQANNAAVEEEASPTANIDLSKVELPPPIVKTYAYRCDDGAELFVQVLEGEKGVLVKDKEGDVPARLARQGGSFSGEERTLSGTGEVVTYSGPGRSNQRCGR